ncbi:uncharacterized protein O3C94_004841 [Discoglossus pictus]
MFCINATTITNRTWWAQYMVFINMDTTVIDTGHVKRLPSTCEKVGTAARKTVIHAEVIFPRASKCSKPTRVKRTWYDTLLGGYGTAAGVLNIWDIETLANRMYSAGSKVNDVLTLQAKSMPTIWRPLQLSAGNDDMINNLLQETNQFNGHFDKNVTLFVNCTVCNMRVLWEEQQKRVMQTKLMTGNEQVWRTVFNDSIDKNDWVHLDAPKMVCNDTNCKDIIVLYNITKISIMCKFIVLPLMMGPPSEVHYWVPTFYGTYIDSRNVTHDLSFCMETLKGKICKIQSSVYEPCLLRNTINVCKWTILLPTYR